jgi:molybdate transport repressor ModE-like protein
MTDQKGIMFNDIRLHHDLWLEFNGNEKVLTDDEFMLLLELEKTGSFSQSSVNLNISTRRAWALVRNVEEHFGFPLFKKHKEYSGSRKYEMTPKGMELLSTWKALHYEADTAMKSIANVFFRRIRDIYEDK